MTSTQIASMRWALTLQLGTLGSWACSDAQTSAPAAGDLWEIDMAPSLVIGHEAATSEAVFHAIADVTQLGDGRIAVANGGFASRLPLFSADGSYLRTLGRSGEGPGEYQRITSVQVGPADSLLVFDASLQRLTVYAEDGGVRTAQHRVTDGGAGEPLRVVTRLDSDVWLGLGEEMPLFGNLHEILEDTVLVGTLDAQLEGFRLLTTVPGRMSMTFEVGGGSAYGGAPFSPQALFAARGQCVFVADGRSPRVSVYSPDGGLTHEIETPHRSRVVSAEHTRQWVDHRLGLMPPDMRPVYRQAFDGIPWVKQMPHFKQMIVDQWGRLWLQPYEPPTGLGRRWNVYAPNGEHLGDALLPTPMTVLEITERGVLGATTSEFDEEIVILLPLGPVPVPGEGFRPCRT